MTVPTLGNSDCQAKESQAIPEVIVSWNGEVSGYQKIVAPKLLLALHVSLNLKGSA